MLFEVTQKGFFSVIEGIAFVLQQEDIQSVMEICDWKFHDLVLLADAYAALLDNGNIVTEQQRIIDGATIKQIEEILTRRNFQNIDPIGIIEILE